MMEIQQANLHFLGPIAVAYAAACGGWRLNERATGIPPTPAETPQSERPWLDLGLAIVASVAIVAIGQLWWSGSLIPETGRLGRVAAILNHLVIYSPIALVLLIRRQGPETLLLPRRAIVVRVLLGILLGIVGVVVFLAMRSELHRFPAVMRDAFGSKNLMRFTPVFLEGVAVAFLFVRARWTIGHWPALLLPCLLFAIGHVRRQVESGEPALEMMLFFGFNVALPLMIFSTVVRSRDVIWIGVTHYIVNVASGAFE